MSKIKIEIKNRWSGKILFEYERENNTLKSTLEKAIEEKTSLRNASLINANLSETNLKRAKLEYASLRGASLRGASLKEADLREADLRGADLRGADLRGARLEGARLEGACISMWDVGEPNINEIITELENNSNLKIKKYYINKHISTPVDSKYWENGLIIDEYDVVDTKVKEMTISEISEALGFKVKVVEEHE